MLCSKGRAVQRAPKLPGGWCDLAVTQEIVAATKPLFLIPDTF